MGAELKGESLTVTQTAPVTLRRAAIHVADHVGAEHPSPMDDLMPRLAGRELAKSPVVAAGLRELLEALGLKEAR